MYRCLMFRRCGGARRPSDVEGIGRGDSVAHIASASAQSGGQKAAVLGSGLPKPDMRSTRLFTKWLTEDLCGLLVLGSIVYPSLPIPESAPLQPHRTHHDDPTNASIDLPQRINQDCDRILRIQRQQYPLSAQCVPCR